MIARRDITILPHRLYGTREVFCDWMGYARLRWYHDNKQRLAERGFPQPIPKPGWPKWRGEDLLAWARADAALKEALDAPGTNVTSLAQVARARSAALINARRQAS